MNSLGGVVVPMRDKTPLLKNWPRLRSQDCTNDWLLTQFNRGNENIGIVLGEPSSGLISIDFDAEEPLAEFLALNPMAVGTLRTKAVRGCNLWFRIKGEYPPLTILKKEDRIFAEWRSTGGLTVIAGIHPSGEHYISNNKSPLKINFNELKWPLGVEWKHPTSPNSSELLNAASLNSEYLNPCNTESLHNKPLDCYSHKTDSINLSSASAIADNIQGRNKSLDNFQKTHPSLFSLYEKLIEPKFKAMPHQRNAFLMQAVPYLYRVVGDELNMELVGLFHDANRGLFNDSKAQHMKEARAMLKGVADSYRKELNQGEQVVYLALKPPQREAFRICRDLALRKDENSPDGRFFMSCNELASRLGKHPPQAYRLLGEFMSVGLLGLITKGQKRKPGMRAMASEFEWKLA